MEPFWDRLRDELEPELAALFAFEPAGPLLRIVGKSDGC